MKNETVQRSSDPNVCYCGAYGGGKHTKSARCDGSREPTPELRTSKDGVGPLGWTLELFVEQGLETCRQQIATKVGADREGWVKDEWYWIELLKLLRNKPPAHETRASRLPAGTKVRLTGPLFPGSPRTGWKIENIDEPRDLKYRVRHSNGSLCDVLAEYVVLDEPTSEKAFAHLCAPHGKDWLTCPECAKAAGFGPEQHKVTK